MANVDTTNPAGEGTLAEICSLLVAETGHDFSAYKSTTLARRVEKRVQARQCDSLDAYLAILREDPAEARALLEDLLISVTEFFRDPDAFAAIEQLAIPPMLERLGAGEPLRVWVPACATGQEAYSLAALLLEAAKGRSGPELRVQVFATDIDRAALEVARQGRYPTSAADQIPPKLLDRWFKRVDHSIQVTPELREICAFSEHSLIKDPPFSRIDLISCRNVFIYWQAELQSRVLPIFHYALRPGGFLFLGAAENIGTMGELFRVADKRSRIFERVATPPGTRLPLIPPTRGRQANDRPATLADRDVTRTIAAALLENHAPPAVVVNELGEIAFFSGRTGGLLEAPTGAPSNNVFELVPRPLRPEMHALVHRAVKTQETVAHPGLPFERQGLVRRVVLTVRPLGEIGRGTNLYMIVFEEHDVGRTQDEARAEGIVVPHPGSAMEQLESELRDTREHLQSTIEEVKSSNEELLSMNEELQSANEELQTSREELQSTNEELETVNGELSRKVEELDHANSDLQNFFANTHVPTLFLDPELKIQNFTPSTSRLFRLLPTDIGRSIRDIASTVETETIAMDASRVGETLQPVERELRSKDLTRHFIMRMSPYRTLANVISGVVATFADVTDLKNAQLREASLAAIVESSGDAIIGLERGRIASWNPGAERLYGFVPSEALCSPISLIAAPEGLAELTRHIERVERAEPTDGLQVECVRKDGKRVWVFLTASPVLDRSGVQTGVSLISRDITERRRAAETQARLAAIVENSDDAIVGKTLDGIVTSWNRGAEQLFGYTPEEMIGKPIFRIVPPDHPDDVIEILSRIRRGEVVHHFETSRLHKNGHRVDVSLSVSPIRDAAGVIVGASKIARDITQAKQTRAALEAALASRDDFISIASHELRTPLTSMRLQTQMYQRATAKGGAAKYTPERTKILVERVDRQLDRLTRLIDDMLDVSRVGGGKLELVRTPTDLSELVAEIVSGLAGHIAEAGCTAELDLAPGVVGSWDRGRIDQVITNLLTNACRYAKGTKIRIRTRIDGDRALLEVSDGGPGVALEDHERIFERFERAATLPAGGGFGIGLYIVRELVRSHGGEVTVESELGKGATFKVSLPTG